MSYTISIEVYDETPGAGSLGRIKEHDSRSRSYAYAAATRNLPTKSVRHERRIPILDQGQLSSCTFNAVVGALGTSPFYETLPAGTVLNEDLAVKGYSLATHLDSYKGFFPPDDTGSSGLAAGKAAVQLGLLSGYQHAFSLEDALNAGVERPFITGIPWMDSFDEPDGWGQVHILASSTVRGGHEVVVDEIDAANHLIGIANSWGPGWGQQGRFYLSWDDYAKLLKQGGDATILVPLTAPAPTPTPPAPKPTASAESLALWDSAKKWAKSESLV